MKGIEAMIATVLVIAFTVAVGGIVSLFLNRLATTQTGEAERGTSGITECADAFIDIVNFNASGHTAVIHNPSKNSIYTTSIFDDMSNFNTSNAAKVHITAGDTSSFVVNNLPASSATKITVTGVCQNSAGTSNTSIIGVCRKGAACWTN
jgi:hypothetical protein